MSILFLKTLYAVTILLTIWFYFPEAVLPEAAFRCALDPQAYIELLVKLVNQIPTYHTLFSVHNIYVYSKFRIWIF